MNLLLTLIFLVNFNLTSINCEAPISNDRFNKLYETIKIKNGDHQKYVLINAYAQRECLSVKQILRFIDLITEHKIKVSTVQSVYLHVYDFENREQLITGFSEHEKFVVKKSLNK